MKLIGIVLINLASIITGINMAQRLKTKYTICCELIEMCSLMSIELGYFSNDTEMIIKNLAEEPALSHLYFLSIFNPEDINIITELSASENEKLNALFKMLGTTDTSSMLDMLESFKASIEESKKKYMSRFKSHGKLYTTFGIFSGIAVSIMLV